MFLKVLRGFFIVCGLGLLLIGPIAGPDEVDNDTMSVPQDLGWVCRPDGSNGQVQCTMDSGHLSGSGIDLSESSLFNSLSLLGLGLIGAAIGLGQFQPRPTPQNPAPAQPTWQPDPAAQAAWSNQPAAQPGWPNQPYAQPSPTPQPGAWNQQQPHQPYPPPQA
jgi:hypothetical protein